AEILGQKRPPRAAPSLKTPAGDLSGRWDLRIEYAASNGTHTFHLKQEGNRITGTHQGEYLSREIAGTIDGDEVQLASNVSESHGDALSFRFTGKLQGDGMSGALDMGEYLNARWAGKRHTFGAARRGE